MTAPATTEGADEQTTILFGHRQDPEDLTTIVPATAAASETTLADAGGAEISGLAALGGSQSARTWFDQRLRDFATALSHDQTGRLRSPVERRALAAAARDMIERLTTRASGKAAHIWPGDALLQPGQLLANTFYVRALIARGGVGEIYRARHRDLKTEHAIKILLPHHALDPTLVTLMLEEARLLLCVQHEGVVGCQGLLRDADGRLMLVMDYLRGSTLSARLREGPLLAPDLTQLARRLAAALSAIHAQKIVHQDISPDNIMLCDDSCDRPKIIDFGLARSNATPDETQLLVDFAGKFSWVSPEQLTGQVEAVDFRSDLYSLGLVLAAAGRGRRLDMGSDPASARAARLGIPVLDGVPEPVASLVWQLLAPRPAIGPRRLRRSQRGSTITHPSARFTAGVMPP
jgi:tRNA A-37 threonylcarbamoyl transferase component Bud32